MKTDEVSKTNNRILLINAKLCELLFIELLFFSHSSLSLPSVITAYYTNSTVCAAQGTPKTNSSLFCLVVIASAALCSLTYIARR